MKVELIKRITPGATFYHVTVDGMSKKCETDQNKAKEFFDQLKANPTLFDTREEVIESVEV